LFPDHFCQGEFSNHLPECSIKSFTLSLQTPWTSFDPYLYSGESSFADPALVENSNCKVFNTQQGHYDQHNACHAPGTRMVYSAFHSIKAVASQVGALPKGLQASGD